MFWQSGCIRAKVVVFVQSVCIRAKVVVFGQIDCIRVKVVVLGKKKVFFRQKYVYSVKSCCIL